MEAAIAGELGSQAEGIASAIQFWVNLLEPAIQSIGLKIHPVKKAGAFGDILPEASCGVFSVHKAEGDNGIGNWELGIGNWELEIGNWEFPCVACAKFACFCYNK